MENSIDSKAERAQRLRELEKMLNKARHLSREEFAALLRETRNNYAILLAMKAVAGITKDSGAYLNVIEKVHYILESIEGKPTARIDIQHKIQNENRQELRRILSDPRNAKDILEIEGVLLEHMPEPNA